MLTFGDVHWPLQMCDAYMAFTCYTICIPAMKCRRMKEMLLYLSLTRADDKPNEM